MGLQGDCTTIVYKRAAMSQECDIRIDKKVRATCKMSGLVVRMAICRLWVQAKNDRNIRHFLSNEQREPPHRIGRCPVPLPTQYPAKAREPNVKQRHVPHAYRTDPSLPLCNHPHPDTIYQD